MYRFIPVLLILGLTVPNSFGSFILRGLGSGKCQNIFQGTSANGANNVIWDCMTFADNELFDSIPVNSIYNYNGETYFQLKVKHSGKCLDVYGGETATGNGARLVQWDCIPTDKAQMFTYVPSRLHPGYYMIKARHSGKCINVYNNAINNQGQIVQWDCVDGVNDNWEVMNCIVPYSSTSTTAFDEYLKLLFKR